MDRLRRDAARVLKDLPGNAREGSTDDTVSMLLPDLSGNPQRCALAAAGWPAQYPQAAFALREVLHGLDLVAAEVAGLREIFSGATVVVTGLPEARRRRVARRKSRLSCLRMARVVYRVSPSIGSN